MKRIPASLATLLLSVVTVLAAGAPPTASPQTTDSENAGRALAEKLRNAAPAGNARFSGVLRIRRHDGQIEMVPLTSVVSTGAMKWQVTYATTATDKTAAETLTIVHTPGRANEYVFLSGTNRTESSVRLTAEEAARPLAGSDFWLSDLGLEFFHWPRQRLLKPEMRLSRSCRVLESVNPAPDSVGYARVLSWIDVETDGLIRAEAYDKQNKLIKEFNIGSFKKIDGQYQLQDMKIRDTRTGQRTELKFDLDK